MANFEDVGVAINSIRVLNPYVTFGKLLVTENDIEWCGSAKGTNLNLPSDWKYLSSLGKIIGPDFPLYYKRDKHCK